jgi:hypothetical protein
MKFSLKGRVRNLPLSPYRKQLQPLFKAVINSIQAIQEAKTKNGYIDILVEREDRAQRSLMPDLAELGAIRNFIVKDNGIGFDDNNFASFETSDTTYKENQGAKGVGRLFWLKAFDSVSVRSTFRQNGVYKERVFQFIADGEGITGNTLKTTRSRTPLTEVRLQGYKKPYQQHCPKSIPVIADRLLEQCLIFLLSDNCPIITLSDGVEKVSLTELLAAHEYEKDHFTLKGEEFTVIHLSRYETIERLNKLHFCAHDRTVYSKDIRKKIPDLATNLVDDSDRPFRYAAIVEGVYLDDHVSPDRTRFEFSDRPDDEASLFEDSELSREEIESEVVNKIRQFFGERLKSISNEKVERIRRHIEAVTPQFRPVLAYKLDRVLELRPDLSADDLTAALHRIYYELQLELKVRTRKVLTGQITDEAKYEQESTKLVRELSVVSKSELAQHVVHRKLILQLLETILSRGKDSKYRREEIVHKLIFPMRTNSDKVFEEDQNLWIIDDKLAYHKYPASDVELRAMSGVVTTASRKRPDILVYNQITLAGDEDPHESIVILEFKRPMRANYGDEDNPIEQVYGYIDDIRAGKAATSEGRPLRAKPNARFFVYILCDQTDKIVKYAKAASFTPAPDENGYFHYNNNYHAYVEIIPFDKLLSDAKKRNRILFEKLDLPYS